MTIPFLEILVKASLIVGAAAVVNLGVLRRASAAWRHMVWAMVVASLVALPILSATLPRWNLPIRQANAAALELRQPIAHYPETIAAAEVAAPSPAATGFTPQEWEILANEVRSWAIDFMMTPFSVEAFHHLHLCPIDAWKIGSAQIRNEKLIRMAAREKTPLFISTGAISNLIYRLSEVDGGTLIAFRHSLVGPVPDEFQQNMAPGWEAIHARVKRAAEAARPE